MDLRSNALLLQPFITPSGQPQLLELDQQHVNVPADSTPSERARRTRRSRERPS